MRYVNIDLFASESVNINATNYVVIGEISVNYYRMGVVYNYVYYLEVFKIILCTFHMIN